MGEQEASSLSPGKITGAYVAFGVAWAAVTDWVLVAGDAASETVALVEAFDTVGFVVASTLLVFGLTRARQRRTDRSVEKLRTATEQLQVLHRVLRHNIRNDLNVIQGNVELVRERLGDDEGRARLDSASRSAERVTALSEKVRVVSDVEGPLSGGEVDLVALTNSELARLRERYPNVDPSTSMPKTAFVFGDPTLRYAVREVLENAVRHNTHPPEACELDVHLERQYGEVELVVADNGPGIPREELAPLRTRRETALSHMSGIGLWLVSWLSQYRGGEVSFDVDGEAGTTVTFRFPVGTQIPLYRGE